MEMELGNLYPNSRFTFPFYHAAARWEVIYVTFFLINITHCKTCFCKQTAHLEFYEMSRYRIQNQCWSKARISLRFGNVRAVRLCADLWGF
jgi:hypothetical protein